MLWMALAMADDLLPTPYTADQIRDACVQGLQIHWDNRDGANTVRQVWTVVEHGEEQVSFAYAIEGEETVTRQFGWEELRQHASFPAASTTKEDVTLETAMGPVEAWHYTVAGEPRKDFWFAKEWAGPPALMTVTHEGTVVARMEQVLRVPPS